MSAFLGEYWARGSRGRGRGQGMQSHLQHGHGLDYFWVGLVSARQPEIVWLIHLSAD